MRSRQDKADPAFLDEKTARKQAERQVLLDALSGGLEGEAIEWTADTPESQARVPSEAPEAPDLNAGTNNRLADKQLRGLSAGDIHVPD